MIFRHCQNVSLRFFGISFVLMIAFWGAMALAAQADSRPNIIVILVDDMGYSDLGCYGGEIPTPNLDQMASDGVRFTQFYNTARCCPTRASLMTGLHPHQTGIGYMTNTPKGMTHDQGVEGYRGFLNRKCVTIGEVLKEAGYHTYISGKWHLGIHGKEKWPLQRGFERYYGIIHGACDYFRPNGDRGLTYGNESIEPEGDNYYSTDAFTDYAIRFLREQKDEKPFFLYLAYNAPHWPLHAKKEDVEKFVVKYMKGWDHLRTERHRKQLEIGLLEEKWKLSPRGARAWEKLSDEKKKEMDLRMAVFAAQVHCMDANVGRLVSDLKKMDKLDNTLIFFLSDNGGCAEGGELGGGDRDMINKSCDSIFISYGKAWANASNTPFRRYKHFVHEGGISTPLIIHWPEKMKAQKGSFFRKPAYLIDLMPTIIEAANAEYPTEYNGNKIQPLEGKSLMPVIEDRQWAGHKYMYWEHEGNCAVRKGHWKAIQKFGKNNWELYNIEQDRTELHDLAKKKPELVKRLSEKWHQWACTHKVIPKKPLKKK